MTITIPAQMQSAVQVMLELIVIIYFLVCKYMQLRSIIQVHACIKFIFLIQFEKKYVYSKDIFIFIHEKKIKILYKLK